MFVISRSTRYLSSLGHRVHAVPSALWISRSWASRRDNNVEGRDRLALLGNDAS